MQDTHEKGSLSLNTAAYHELLNDFNLSNYEKQSLLDSLFLILSSFVDQAFGIHPIQLACGQVSGVGAKAPNKIPDSAMLEDTHNS